MANLFRCGGASNTKKTYVIKNGVDVYGMRTSSYRHNSWGYGAEVAPTLTSYDGYLKLSLLGASAGSYWSQQKIDLSKYTKLHYVYRNVSGVVMNLAFSSEYKNYPTFVNASNMAENPTENFIEATNDISNLSGLYYIVCLIASPSSGITISVDIKNMWFE